MSISKCNIFVNIEVKERKENSKMLCLIEIYTVRSQGGLNVIKYRVLENNPKQIRTLIGLKPCFYNSIETQN